MLATDWVSIRRDEDLHRDRRDIHTDGVFHAASDLLIGEFLENAGTAAGAHDHGVGQGRGNHAAQDSPGQHQCVGVRGQRQDGDVDAF